MLESIIISIFIIAFIFIVLEEILTMNKAKPTLFFGTLAWIILFISAKVSGKSSFVETLFNETILEIAILWLFLISAMTFVAYMDKRGFIENTLHRYLPDKISERKLLFIIGCFAFFSSSLIDNLTATLVSLAFLLTLKLEGKKLIKFAVFIVFSANAGGLWLITGDITTLMLFIANKFTIPKLAFMIFPAFISMATLYLLFIRGLDKNIIIKKGNLKPCRVDSIMAIVFLLTIVMIIVGNVFFNIPPVLPFLFGLSIMFMIAWLHKHIHKEDLKILEYFREIEFNSLFFFLGVLLLVGVLREIGILAGFVNVYNIMPTYVSSFIMGIVSAFVDNIPLTAAIIKSGIDLGQAGWLTLNYAVGVGGSLLAIGSAAGVVAMGRIKELTFSAYLRYTGYVFIAYVVGFIATYITSNMIT